MIEGMDLVRFSRAMADETRQQIMDLLCCQWLCVSDVVDRLDVSQPTVSHHLAVLREVGLVRARREGKQVYYTLDQDVVASCCGQLMYRFAPTPDTTPIFFSPVDSIRVDGKVK